MSQHSHTRPPHFTQPARPPARPPPPTHTHTRTRIRNTRPPVHARHTPARPRTHAHPTYTHASHTHRSPTPPHGVYMYHVSKLGNNFLWIDGKLGVAYAPVQRQQRSTKVRLIGIRAVLGQLRNLMSHDDGGFDITHANLRGGVRCTASRHHSA